MRSSTINGILTSLGNNAKRRNKDVRLYELGNVYLSDELPLQKLPDERTLFTLAFYGVGDFFDLKGVVEEFLSKLGLNQKAEYSNQKDKSFLHPGRQAVVTYQGVNIAYLGQVHPTVGLNYGLKEEAYLAVLDINSLLSFATFARKYIDVPRFPAVNRDISMTIAKEIVVGQIEAVIGEKGGAYLEDYTLFDIYEGEQIPAGLKSVAYSLTFRAKDKTLEEAEVSQAMDRILKGLEAIGAKLRD